MDTNILVRLIVGDDAGQVERILALSSDNDFFVSLTVLMETEWVLRSRFGFGRTAIYTAFVELPNLCAISFEDSDGIAWALSRYATAGELADFIHIIAARKIGKFATFEKRLPTRAGDGSPSEILIVP